MKELSLNIIDIAENSLKASASLVTILITENESLLTIEITDDGTGMSKDTLTAVENPFFTTRTTRKVGMGIPLFRMSAEQTGGSFRISSRHIDAFPNEHGTSVYAEFNKKHIDFTPLGDIISSIVTLIQGHPTVDFLFIHKKEDAEVKIDTREMRQILEDVPLNSFEVLLWVRENLAEQYGIFNETKI